MQRSKGGYPNRKYLSRKRRWSSCRRRRWTSISRAGIASSGRRKSRWSSPRRRRWTSISITGIASSGRRRKMQRITVKNDSFYHLFIYFVNLY